MYSFIGVTMWTWSVDRAYLRCMSDRINDEYGIDWLEVRLPSTVQEALFVHGIIEDPYVESNWRRIQWVSRYGWVYRIPIERRRKCSRVVFHGVDYRYRVRSGDRLLATHEGMFSQCYVDVSGLPEKTEILVEVLPNPSSEREFVIPEMWGRKKNMRIPMSYGWDFAPRIITIGIWDIVEIQEDTGGFIDDLHVRAFDNGELHMSFRTSPEYQTLDVKTLLLDGDTPILSDIRRSVKRRNKGFSLRYSIPDIELWWPWDLGHPKLYDLEIRLMHEGEEISSIVQKIGFRRIIFRNGALIINGTKIYMRGVNWPPIDSLLRFDRERYERLIKSVLDLNCNIIRVWGGGLRERREFYRLTDRNGILVWQEFPFACEDVILDDRMRLLIDRECTSIVKCIRNHPSLSLLCGGNELNYRRSYILIKILGGIVRQYAPDIPFHPISPYKYDSHSWYVWYGFAPLGAYLGEQAPIISEFGMQSIPGRESLTQFIPKNKLWPPNNVWIEHKAQIDILYYYTITSLLEKISIVLLNAIESVLLLLKMDKKRKIRNIIYRKTMRKLARIDMDEFIW